MVVGVWYAGSPLGIGRARSGDDEIVLEGAMAQYGLCCFMSAGAPSHSPSVSVRCQIERLFLGYWDADRYMRTRMTVGDIESGASLSGGIQIHSAPHDPITATAQERSSMIKG